MLKAILLSSLFINLGLLVGRLSGFARESFLAASFGIGPESDVAVLMLSLPDLLVNILIGGGIAASLIPEFNRSPQFARTLLFQSLLAFSGMFLVFSFALNWYMPWVLSVFAPGFSEFQNSIALAPMQLVMWLVPLTVATGVVASYLNAHNRFLASSMGTLVINSVIMGGLLAIYYNGGGLEVLALFILLGGAVRLLVQFAAAVRVAGLPRFAFSPWVINKQLMARFLQVAGAGSVLLSFPVVVRAYASYGATGDVALFSFASKLVELPLAIAVTFLSVVLFPRLSKAYTEDKQQFHTIMVWGVRATLFLSLLALAVLYPVSSALADIVYGYGKMNSHSIMAIAQLTSIALFYIPFMGLATFVAACFNAMHDTITPLIINMLMLVMLLVFLALLPALSLADLVASLVVAYMGVGSISMLVLLLKHRSLLGQLIDGFYLPLILLVCVCAYGLLAFLLPLLAALPMATSSVLPIVLAACVAAMVTLVGVLFVPQVRTLVRKKVFKL